METPGLLHVGTSGYAYDKWQGRFYPEDINKKNLLHYYSGFFDTVKINLSFYSLPTVAALKKWQKDVPKNFLICLKISRYISHNKKLKDCADAVSVFMQRARQLRGHRGPLLLQLPPNLKPQYERLDEVLSLIHRESKRWPVAVEIRNDAWLGSELNDVLDRHRASLVVHDMPEGRTDSPNQKAPLIYMRFHGPKGDYHGKYGESKLKPYINDIRRWLKEGRDVYAFFNNDADGFAPEDAQTLARLV